MYSIILTEEIFHPYKNEMKWKNEMSNQLYFLKKLTKFFLYAWEELVNISRIISWKILGFFVYVWAKFVFKELSCLVRRIKF